MLSGGVPVRADRAMLTSIKYYVSKVAVQVCCLQYVLAKANFICSFYL